MNEITRDLDLWHTWFVYKPEGFVEIGLCTRHGDRKVRYQHYCGPSESFCSSSCRPDMTFAVDWALSNNYLSIFSSC